MSTASTALFCAVLLLSLVMPGLAPTEGLAGFSLKERLGKRKTDKATHAAKPAPADFAARFRVTGTEDALLSLELPATVYERLRRDDYRDICVFDSDGKPVPFSLIPAEDYGRRTESAVASVPFFYWPPDSGREDRRPADTGMEVDIDTRQGTVHIRRNGSEPSHGPGGPAEAQAPSEVAAKSRPSGADSLVIDLSDFQNSVPEGFSGSELRSATLTLIPERDLRIAATVEVSGSDDLARWRPWRSDQTIVRIVQGETKIERLELSSPIPCPRYARIRFKEPAPGFEAVAVKGEYAKRVVKTQEKRIHAVLARDGRSAEYAVPGAYPLVAVNFLPAQADIMAIRLDAKSEAHSGIWRPVLHGRLYLMRDNGLEIRNPPFALARSPGRLWRLSSASDVPFASAPELLLTFRPHTLYFVSRGSGPWTVAYGRALPVSSPSFPAGQLDAAGQARVLEGEADSDPAEAVMEHRDGNAGAASAESDEASGMILWAALCLAAVVLTGMAVYILRGKQE